MIPWPFSKANVGNNYTGEHLGIVQTIKNKYIVYYIVQNDLYVFTHIPVCSPGSSIAVKAT